MIIKRRALMGDKGAKDKSKRSNQKKAKGKK